MKAIFETDDKREAVLFAKSEDMAGFIFEVINNSWRKFKETNIEYEPIYNEIGRLAALYGVDIPEIINNKNKKNGKKRV